MKLPQPAPHALFAPALRKITPCGPCTTRASGLGDAG